MDNTASHTLRDRLALELDNARKMLEDLAAQLCFDRVVFERHAVLLQQFDQIAQLIGEVSSVLRHIETASEAIDAIGLEAMRTRLAEKRFQAEFI